MKTLHTLTGMGSTALAAAVPYSGKATEFSTRDNDEQDKKTKKVKYKRALLLTLSHGLREEHMSKHKVYTARLTTAGTESMCSPMVTSSGAQLTHGAI